MARILGAFPAALIAARGGLSQNAFIRELRAAGMGARDAEVRALYKLAQQTLQKSGDEPFGNPDLVPDLSTARPWPTISATGVKQAIEITYRQKSTGTLVTVPYQVTSETGVTRAEAIETAVNAYASQAERYGQELVGAVHTKTFVMVPSAVSGIE
jgi:hypothetical protein